MSETYLFLTISLDTPLTINEAVDKKLRQVFPTFRLSVMEYGDNGKAHMHAIGIPKPGTRPTNLVRDLGNILDKAGYNVGPKSILCSKETRSLWRIGYLQKELTTRGGDLMTYGYVIDKHACDDTLLQSGWDKYQLAPKAVSDSTKIKKLSMNALAQHMIEQECGDAYSIFLELTTLREEGSLDFNTYQKLNVKKLVQYVSKNWAE